MIYFCFFGTIWMAATTLGIAMAWSRLGGEAQLGKLRLLGVGWAVVSALVPMFVETSSNSLLEQTKWVHRAGVLSLFAFLGFAAFSLRMGQIALERADEPGCRAYYKRLWIATELWPSVSAVLFVTSGLRLLSLGGSNSLLVPWQFWMSAAAFAFMFDGVFSFTPATAALYRHHSIPKLEHIRLWTHILSFPMVFALGMVRPDLPHPCAAAVIGIQDWGKASLGSQLGNALPAFLLLAAIALAMWLLALPRRRWR